MLGLSLAENRGCESLLSSTMGRGGGGVLGPVTGSGIEVGTSCAPRDGRGRGSHPEAPRPLWPLTPAQLQPCRPNAEQKE